MMRSHNSRACTVLKMRPSNFRSHGASLLHGVHERIGRQHGEVEHRQPSRRALGVDELFDVGMIAGERRHHRAAPRARRHDRAAHRVPHFHEGDGTGRIRAHAFHGRAFGPERREIVADAAALLQRQRRLAQMGEDAAHVVGDGAHDEAVEERDAAVGAGARQDSPCRQEAIAGQGFGERQRPFAALFGRLGLRRRQRHARPAVGHVAVDGRAVGRFQPVFHVPDLARDIAHGGFNRSCYVLIPQLGLISSFGTMGDRDGQSGCTFRDHSQGRRSPA